MLRRKSAPRRPAAKSEDPHASGNDFVARCRAGQPGIKEEFVSSYGPLVRFAAFSILRKKDVRLDENEVDDLIQGLTLFFLEQDCRRLKMYTGRDGASFATFVRVCACRHTLDQIRRWQRQPVLVRDASTGEERSIFEELRSPQSGPEETVAAREQVSRIRDLVKGLPKRERILVRLHFVEGLSVPEVANVLGLSSNATHVIKSRLRTRLREALGGPPDA